MSAHRAHPDHRRVDHRGSETSPRDAQGLGRSHSNATVAATLGVGIGVLLFLLALPYLGAS